MNPSIQNEAVNALLEEARQKVNELWPTQQFYVAEVKEPETQLFAKAPSNTVRAKGKIGGAERMDPVGKSSMTASEALSAQRARQYTGVDSPEFTRVLREFLEHDLQSRGLEYDEVYNRLESYLRAEINQSQALLSKNWERQSIILGKASEIARRKRVNWEDKSQADKMTWIRQHSDDNGLKREIEQWKKDRSYLMAAINAKEEDMIAMAENNHLPGTIAAAIMYLIEANQAMLEYQKSLFSQDGEVESRMKVGLKSTTFSIAGRSMLTLLLQIEGYLESKKRGQVAPRIEKVKKKKKYLFFKAAPSSDGTEFKTDKQMYDEAKAALEGKKNLVITKETGPILIEGTMLILDPSHIVSLPQSVSRLDVELLNIEWMDNTLSVKMYFADYTPPEPTTPSPLVSRPTAVVRMVHGIPVSSIVNVRLDVQLVMVGESMESVGFINGSPVCLIEGQLQIASMNVLEHLQTHQDRHQLAVSF